MASTCATLSLVPGASARVSQEAPRSLSWRAPLLCGSRARSGRRAAAGQAPPVRCAIGAGAVAGGSGRATSGPQAPPRDLAPLKADILRLTAGLDRGLAASDEDERQVAQAVRALELAAGPVRLADNLWKLQGRWRLIFSSGFSSGSLGGNRPGPPVGRLPIVLGQVSQRIDVASRELDNCVDLKLGTPWPLPAVDLSATLAHSFELFGTNGIRIVFEKTSVRGAGGLSGLPPFVVPQLPSFLREPSAQIRSGEFETTFLEDDMRISRGDRGELRVFVKT